MIRIGVIVSEPEVVERSDGFEVYTATIELADTGEVPAPRIPTTFASPAEGISWAFRRGQRVRAWVTGGTSFVVATCAATTADGLHHWLLAPTGIPAGKSEAGNVRAGRDANGDWQPAMAFTQAHNELLSLRSALLLTMGHVASLLVTRASPGDAAAAEALGNTASDLFGLVQGGKGSEGFEVQTIVIGVEE